MAIKGSSLYVRNYHTSGSENKESNTGADEGGGTKYADGDVSVDIALAILRGKAAENDLVLQRLPFVSAVLHQEHSESMCLSFSLYIGDWMGDDYYGSHMWAFLGRPNDDKERAPPMVLATFADNKNASVACYGSSDELDLRDITFDQAFDGVIDWHELYALVKYYRLLLAQNFSDVEIHHIPINETFLQRPKSVCNRSPKNDLLIWGSSQSNLRSLHVLFNFFLNIEGYRLNLLTHKDLLIFFPAFLCRLTVGGTPARCLSPFLISPSRDPLQCAF
jgi:hypothetical protein